METKLSATVKSTSEGIIAESILRACVHCGFCNATCPTYQLLGDELDGPRGRIYQIKQVLEGAAATPITQLHLDRCLTCRSCESTCPSGVKYGQLLDIGRAAVQAQVPRPLWQRGLHRLLRETLTRRRVFGIAMRLGRAVRFALPSALKAKLQPPRPAGPWPRRHHARKVILLRGCTQPAMLPSIDAATARVLDALGVEVVVMHQAGCCGAIRQHLDDHSGALDNMRRNIDVWWPLLSSGTAEAIVINASGCAVTVKEYGHLLRDDPAYADKAQRVSQWARDLTEFLLPQVPTLRSLIAQPQAQRVALQVSCTLQHGQRLAGKLESLLQGLGVQLPAIAEAHLCCGSAGTYSLLQPALANSLRDRKLANLTPSKPQMILSANIGCISHLQSGTAVAVWHWIEWLDQALQTALPSATGAEGSRTTTDAARHRRATGARRPPAAAVRMKCVAVPRELAAHE
jgi:glycolate oxidase iron-sulfur subunit